MTQPNRRSFLTLAGAAPLLAEPTPPSHPSKIVVVGAHPDDPESACAGTIARYTSAGHSVTVVYLTRGEAGIRGKSHSEAAAIRTAEAQAACRILGARAVFAGQIDGATEVTPARSAEFHQLIAAEQPDVLFTHWPLDTHPDHRAASLLAYGAWLALRRQPLCFFFEVTTNSGRQSLQFSPTVFVDISQSADRKRQAIYAHSSQGPDHFFPAHDDLARARGLEAGCPRAEAFAPAWRPGPLP